MTLRIERAPNGGEGIVPRPAWDVIDDATGELHARIRYSYGVYEARTPEGVLLGRPVIARDLVTLADRLLAQNSEPDEEVSQNSEPGEPAN